MKRIPILFAIDSVAGNAGTEKQLSQWISRLDQKCFEPHLGCFEDSPQLNQLRRVCSPLVLSAGDLVRRPSLRSFARLMSYLKANRIQIVHAFMVKSSLLAIPAARLAGCPVVLGSRRNLGYWISPRHRRLLVLLNRFTDRIVANSQAARLHAIASEGIPPQKVDVIYNGVDLEQYAPGQGDPAIAESLGIPRQAPLVGCVANYRPVKNLELFIHAAAYVVRAVPQAVFVLVGSGPQRSQLEDLVRRIGLTGKVFFSDGHGEVQDYLCRMSIACLSSHSEGFSNAILEYMAAGLPVVATDSGGNPEAIEDGVTGFLVPSSDPEAFAAPIIKLLQNDALRSAMGRRALERCRAQFDIRQTVRTLEDYYRSLLS